MDRRRAFERFNVESRDVCPGRWTNSQQLDKQQPTNCTHQAEQQVSHARQVLRPTPTDSCKVSEPILQTSIDVEAQRHPGLASPPLALLPWVSQQSWQLQVPWVLKQPGNL